MTRWTRPAYWYNLLTLDHTACTFCFQAGVRGPSIRSQAGYAPMDRMHNRPAWIAQSRAAFRAHVASRHPEMVENIRWAR